MSGDAIGWVAWGFLSCVGLLFILASLREAYEKPSSVDSEAGHKGP